MGSRIFAITMAQLQMQGGDLVESFWKLSRFYHHTSPFHCTVTREDVEPRSFAISQLREMH